MKNKLLRCLTFKEIEPLLSDMAWGSFINLDWFEIWQNTENESLYSLSRGSNIPEFLAFDLPIEKIDYILACMNPFYLEGGWN